MATKTRRRAKITQPQEPATTAKPEGYYTKEYLQDDEYINAYNDSKKYMRYFFEAFDEYERLAANRVRDDLPEGFPRVNDGTLAAMIMEIPMEILGQMVTGGVKVDKVLDPTTETMVDAPGWLREVASIVWEKKIVKKANTDATFYVKWVVALYRALKYGGQPIYDFFTIIGDEYTCDMSLPYVRDVYFQANKISDLASQYIFMDSYFDRLTIRKIIAKAERLKAKGIEQPWIVEALEQVYDSAVEAEKESRNRNEQERDKGVKQEGIRFTTCFQRGFEAPFCTFYEGLAADNEAFLKVKETPNKNRSGDIPIHYLFAFQDLENPLGIGKVERAAGNQNVSDFMTQADVLATQVGVRPPIGIKGNRSNTDLNSLIWAPNQYWFEGDADVQVKQTTNTVYTQMPNRLGMYKSQVLNLLAKTDASISAESGQPGFSKTDAGVKFQATRAGISANFLRQMFNQCFNQVASSMLNQYFANMKGEDIMKITKEEARRLTQAGLIDEDPNTEEPSVEEVKLIWDNMRGIFEFEVDPESSMVKDSEEYLAKAMEVVKMTVENPSLRQEMNASGWDLKLGEAYRQIFTRLGLQDVEKIVVPVQSQAGTPMPGAGGPEAALAGLIGPEEAAAANGGQVPPEGAPPALPAPEVPPSGLTPEAEAELRDAMEQYGLDVRGGLAVLQARAQGVPEEAIIEYLQTGKVSEPAGAGV